MDARETILIVDDDDELRESLVDMLEQRGYRTGAAEDGLRALAYLRDCPAPPALILLDLAMPNMNGAQFREEQLRHAIWASIPVGVLTGTPDVIAGSRWFDAGFIARKPVDPYSLMLLIESALLEHGRRVQS
jgi:CheY-like chemotaxis protein